MKRFLFVLANILAASSCFSQVKLASSKILGGGDPRTFELKGGGDPYKAENKYRGIGKLKILGGGGDPFVTL